MKQKKRRGVLDDIIFTPITEKEEMEKMTKEFYKVLFNEDEWTCFAKNKFGIETYLVHSKGLKEDKQMFSINPMKPQSTRAGNSITIYRNILIEIDDYNDGSDVKKPVPREQQLNWFEEIDLPFATLIWSGGKSYHAIISVKEGFKDANEYNKAVEAIYEVMEKNGIPNDKSVKDPSRLSRAAGALRWDPGTEAQIQEVKEVRKRITRQQLDDWLSTYDVEIKPYIEPTPSTYVTGANDHISDLRKFDTANQWNSKKHNNYSPNMPTGAHIWLFNFGMQIYKVDMSVLAAISHAEGNWGVRYIGSSGGGLVADAITKGWKFAKEKNIKQWAFR